ncbi:MAG TPA: hypothetical protein PLP42_11090, partial [Acidobacteriota bacterium]|nr:hypothetical protein [Acidobacteriota bacterium]
HPRAREEPVASSARHVFHCTHFEAIEKERGIYGACHSLAFLAYHAPGRISAMPSFRTGTNRRR